MYNLKKICLLLILLLFAFCYKEQTNQVFPNKYEVLATEKILIGKCNQIGFDSFKYKLQNREPYNNLIVSPIGISISLNTLMLASDNSVRNKIKNCMGMPHIADSIVIDGYKKINKIFTEVDQNSFFSNFDNFLFSKELKFSKDFISLAEKNNNISYVIDPVSKFVPFSQIKDETLYDSFQLVNILSFKARGKYQKGIEKLPFYYSPDKSDFIEMIVSKAVYNYYGDIDIKALEIPLGIGNYNMLIIMPKDDKSISELAINLNTKMIRKIQNKYQPQLLEVYMPKMKVSAIESYSDFLKQRNLNSCFQKQSPDFEGILDIGNCYISNYQQSIDFEFAYSANNELDAITQKNEIKYNEKGSFFIDRPFLFVVTEKYSEGVILIGKIMNP